MENAGLGKFLRPRRVGPPRAKIFRFHGAEPPSFPLFSWKKKKSRLQVYTAQAFNPVCSLPISIHFFNKFIAPYNNTKWTFWDVISRSRQHLRIIVYVTRKKKKENGWSETFSLRYTSIIYAYTMKMRHTVSSTRAVLSMPSFVMM